MDAHILRRNLFTHQSRTSFEEESGFGDDDTQKTGNQSEKAQSESSFSMPSIKMEHTVKLQFMAPTALQEDKMAAYVGLEIRWKYTATKHHLTASNKPHLQDLIFDPSSSSTQRQDRNATTKLQRARHGSYSKYALPPNCTIYTITT
jgi:hypothetical protein